MDAMTPLVTFDIHLADMQAFWNRKKQSRGKKIFAVVFYGLLFLLFAELLHVNVSGSDPDAAASGLFGVLVGIAGCLWALVIFSLFYTKRSQRRIFEGSICARSPVQVRGDEHAIEGRVAGIVSTYPWSSFLRLESTPTHYFLYVSELEPIVLRRAAVAGTPLGDLVESRVAREGVVRAERGGRARAAP